jgi:predicted transcriptional regulator of viral defense system
MYEADVLEHFRNAPVFSLADVAQIIQNRDYAKKFLRRMIDEGNIIKIKRDFYTIYKDPLLVSTFLVKPSYISSISAMSFHHLTTQIPRNIFCMTENHKKTLTFSSEIYYIPTKYFFGFRNERYDKFFLPVATPEKAAIDSIGVLPLAVLDESFEKIDKDILVEYLKKIRKSSVIKRIGYLAERNMLDVHKELKGFINNKYIFLDPLAKKSGKKDKKWRIIVNG